LFSPGQYVAIGSHALNVPGVNVLCLASTVSNKHPIIVLHDHFVHKDTMDL